MLSLHSLIIPLVKKKIPNERKLSVPKNASKFSRKLLGDSNFVQKDFERTIEVG